MTNCYNAEWKGLDQGVEQTWAPEVIMDTLRVIAEHQPVSHREPTDPFYKAISERVPHITWFSFDKKDNSFRPIFRRSNTWKKLGLIEELDKRYSLSVAGKDLLVGKTSAQSVLLNVCKNHTEKGEKPFVIIAQALSNLSESQIKVDDLINLCRSWRLQDGNVTETLRRLTPISQSELQSSIHKTRNRRFRSMLKILQSAGGVLLKGQSVEIHSVELLNALSSEAELEEAVFKTKTDTQTDLQAKNRSSQQRKEVTKERTIADFVIRAKSTDDEDGEHWLHLVETASREHEQTVFHLHNYLKQQGLKTFELAGGYDLHAEIEDKPGILFEIKTINERNVGKQIRVAVSQLYEYAFKYRGELGQHNHLAIVLNKNPLNLVEQWVLDYLSEDRKINLYWFEDDMLKSYAKSLNIEELI
ncbi:Restriction endonuclease [Vibrio crassostreae]|uniref:hypothetical protein n=1 Tax=Vibrio crassostreae TaxID=246167 RepID=UPI001B30E268|nr:hypothetical protein [Vibrio crassostreae]CAK1952586.1 Restriction endonuclease [Vibrio crassostreae]CAK1954469.1 Restriction endonuclease [Vibrio crassostreae]CAK1954991.1 Restriction endonuclease [Vibrio crassostreae]CAK1961163.1 Restriction endonuclease [Vibrio crassostreae]CAK1961228.1 Restriction endonuclease [Vibrio crassostreae]